MPTQVSGRANSDQDSSNTVSVALGGDVTDGNIVSIMGQQISSTSDGAFVVGDVAKLSGVGTITGLILHSQVTVTLTGGSTDLFCRAGVWSAIVDGDGSLTMELSAGAGTVLSMIQVDEYEDSGGWDSAREEDTATGSNDGSDTAPDTANVTSADAALFLGSICLGGTATVSLSPGSAFTEIGEEQISPPGPAMTGGAEFKVVATGNTDALDWTAGANLGYCAAAVVLKPVTSIEVTPGQATETDAALGVTVNQDIVAGLATETDTALGVSVSKSIGVGQATETDTALAAAVSRTVTTGQATETDTALSASIGQAISAGQATETDSALAASVTKIVSTGQAQETDEALGAVEGQQINTGLATETDEAFAAALSKSVDVGQALETDEALPASVGRQFAVGFATETDTALTIDSMPKTIQCGQALESDEALPCEVEGAADIFEDTSGASWPKRKPRGHERFGERARQLARQQIAQMQARAKQEKPEEPPPEPASLVEPVVNVLLQQPELLNVLDLNRPVTRDDVRAEVVAVANEMQDLDDILALAVLAFEAVGKRR